MSASPAIHEIMESAAQRLECAWAEGGSKTFRIRDSRFKPGSRLCLMDALGAQTWEYIVHSEEPLDELEKSVVLEISMAVIPALYGVILSHPDIPQESKNSMLNPSNEDVWGYLDPKFGGIVYYNDFICKSGADAADIVRRAAKEL